MSGIGFGGAGIGFIGGGPGTSAADITTDGPLGATNVQAALYALLSALGETVGVVSSLADLDKVGFAPANELTGERIFTRPLFILPIIILPDDEWMQYVGPDALLIGISSAVSAIRGNVNGALIRGAVVMRDLATNNTSTGPNAAQFDITSTGRVVRIEYVATGSLSVASAPAGVISNTFNAVSLDHLLLNGIDGFKLRGVLVATSADTCTSIFAPAGSTIFDVEASANVVQALEVNGCNFLTNDATVVGIRISDAATLPGGTPPTTVVGVQILGCKVTGPGNIYDGTGVGELSQDSPKLNIQGNPSLPDSKYLGEGSFTDFGTPIVLTYVGPAPTPWLPVPSQNAGATTVLTLLSNAARFTLLRSLVDPFDWGIQASGPTRQPVAVTWTVSLEASAGPGVGEFLEFRAERQEGGVGPWVEVEGSTQRVEQRITTSNNTHTAYTEASPGDRFRLSRRNFTGTNSTDLPQYNLVVVKS